MPTNVTKTVKSAGGDYSSLSAAEAGVQTTYSNNFVTADVKVLLECYAFADTSSVTVAGTTVDATRYLEIAAAAGAEALMPWSTSTAYRLTPGGASVALNISQSYTRVRRIQIENALDDNNLVGVSIATAAAEVLVRGCYIRNSTSAFTFGSNCIGIDLGTDAAGNRYIINNVIEWDTRAAATGVFAIFSQNHLGGGSYCYNNTVIGRSASTTAKGISDGFGDVFAKNNLVKGFLGGCFSGMTAGNCLNNASDDTTASGTGARISQTFTFAGVGDYHLASGDAGAKDFGVDLSADATYPFADDFDAATRTGTWDTGADEFAGGGGGGTVVPVFMAQYRQRWR